MVETSCGPHRTSRFSCDKDVRTCGKLDFETWNLFQLLEVGKSCASKVLRIRYGQERRTLYNWNTRMYVYLATRGKMSFYAFLTNCVCVKRLLIKFEVASVYGYYYSDLYLSLLYWSTGRGMSFYAILTVYAHY